MNPADPDLYLVRIWRRGAAFRATVRRVDDEALHCVQSAQALAAYFAGDTAASEREPRPSAGERPGHACLNPSTAGETP